MNCLRRLMPMGRSLLIGQLTRQPQFRCLSVSPVYNLTKIDSSPSPLKRKSRKPKVNKQDQQQQQFKNIVALSTGDSYNLEELSEAILKQNIYELVEISEEVEDDVLPIRARYKVNDQPRDIFLFREGSMVCWNCSSEEIDNLIEFVSKYQQSPYDRTLVLKEKEEVDYLPLNDIPKSKFLRGIIHLKNDDKTKLYDQYACSNAIAMSVKLAIWESLLNDFIEKISPITEKMKQGKRLRLTREQVFKRTGELFALRHQINLESDLLDEPDFYWDRDHLVHLYQKTFNYLKLSKRTRVMNEKINDCLSLIELVTNHLNDKHHTRLEWMIILLIMVEVGFEILHYTERYMNEEEIASPETVSSP